MTNVSGRICGVLFCFLWPLLSTNIGETIIAINAWISNNIYIKQWDVFTHPYPNFNGSFVNSLAPGRFERNLRKVIFKLTLGLGLGLGLQGLYSATNCADNILGRFTIILQNQIARVDSFINLTKRWVFRFRLNASISSHNLISFGKQFHARGPYTANARLPKVSDDAWILVPSGHVLHWILWNIFCFLVGWSFLGCR